MTIMSIRAPERSTLKPDRPFRASSTVRPLSSKKSTTSIRTNDGLPRDSAPRRRIGFKRMDWHSGRAAKALDATTWNAQATQEAGVRPSGNAAGRGGVASPRSDGAVAIPRRGRARLSVTIARTLPWAPDGTLPRPEGLVSANPYRLGTFAIGSQFGSWGDDCNGAGWIDP